MLEAQINLRVGLADTAVRKRGDVIAVGLPGTPWGAGDEHYHVIVEWTDADLEAALLAKGAAGERVPLIVYPYAQYDADGNMTQFSTQFLNLASLPSTIRAPLLLHLLSGRRPRIPLSTAAAARRAR